MYRIDENTFIDSSLITCAEYQLFIDEMRGPGKYHQPDHWTTYQFPIGQARQPVLGMRLSDAEDFCIWLSQREAGGEWHYRLPTTREAINYQLEFSIQTPVGCWLAPTEIRRFAWNGAAPVNPRAPVFDFVHDMNFDLALNLNRTSERARNLDFGRIQTSMRTQNIVHSLSRRQSRMLNRILRRADELDSKLIHALDLDLNRARDQARTYVYALDLAYDRIQGLTQTRDLIIKRSFDNDVVTELMVHLNRTLRIVMNIYFDIWTLDERIAGRSPAFEGIRIVKERVK